MPSAHCPRCGATYDSPKITANGPVCRYCLPRGDVVVLLPARPGRFGRSPLDDSTIVREPQPWSSRAPSPG